MNPIVALPEPLVLGLHALGELVRDTSRCMSTQQIAETIGTTEPHLSKVLQRLNKKGLIKSVRGPGGGYRINCIPEETSLSTIFELLGGPFEARDCDMDGCHGKKCFIADMMNELGRAIFRYLDSRTLADFSDYYATGRAVEIEISVITPSFGQHHPNFADYDNQNNGEKP